MESLVTKNVLSIAVAASLTATAWAQAQTAIEEVVVTSVRDRLYQAGMLKDVIQKTEVISSISIEQMNAANLTEAIAEAPGVRVNNECSMCGVKRVMLNGMRGEHTTILVDGIPTYTMMSGFYGLDAAASAGIGNIEIARGAGASLIAPEAIGGTINLVTREAKENGIDIDFSGGENAYKKGSVVATAVANQDTTRITLIGQYDNRDQYDGDNNGVSENPELENTSLTLYLSQDLGSRDNLRLRINHTESEIFGGPTGTNIGEVKTDYNRDPDYDSQSLFVDDDVRNRYIGRTWETTEWIDSERDEAYLSWLHEFNANLNIQTTVSHNTHDQDSFYEGFIYEAEDKMSYGDIRLHWAFTNDHLITFGADTRLEEMRSATNTTSPDYVSDSFDYDTRGLYVQDTWTATENFEMAIAVRIDQVEADFIDPAKPGTEIDESIVSPRLDMRYSHNDQWTSRFSFGRGYRAPLSFFESDHGILDGDLGFDVQIEELERSQSFNYALSFEGDTLSTTASISHTTVENLAALSESDAGIPVLGQMEENADVTVADIALTWQARDNLSLMATIENIDYSDEFKQAFGVVPIEQRMVLSVDWDVAGWDIYSSATWVGSRNLAEYGTPEAPTFDATGLYPKSQKADDYWTVDVRVARELTERWQIYAGVSNVFDYTQVNDMETPLFYEEGGYDVAHIYGPLRGREAYAGVKFSF